MALAMKKKHMSLKEFLLSKGIKADPRYGDYQDYIEDKQEKIGQSLYRQSDVPVRGSIHLALGKIVSKKEIEDRWKSPDSD